jgi:hypothetical protein
MEQANAGIENVARKEYEKKQEKAKKGSLGGKLGGIIGVPFVGPAIAGALGGGPIGAALGIATSSGLGSAAGTYLGGGEPDWGNIAINSAIPAIPTLASAGLDKIADFASSGATTASEALSKARPWEKASHLLEAPEIQSALSSMSSLPTSKQPTLNTAGMSPESASAMRQEYTQQDVVNRRMQQDVAEAAALDKYRQGELAIRKQDSNSNQLRDQAYMQSLNQPNYTRIPEIAYQDGAPMQPVMREQPGQAPEIVNIPIPGTIPQKQQATQYRDIGGVPVPESDIPLLQMGDPDAQARFDTLQKQLPVKPQKPEVPIMVQTPQGQVPMLRSQLPIGQPIPGTAPELKPETVIADRVGTAMVNRFSEDETITPEDKGMLETYTYNIAMKIMQGGQDPGIPTFNYIGQAPVPPDNDLKNIFEIIFYPSGAESPVVEKVAFDIEEAANAGLQEAPK